MTNQNKENKFSKFFDLPNPGLRSYFDRVVAGSDVEYRTTFYKGLSVDKVMRMWMPKLKKLANKWPTLYEFETDLAKKVGPLSIMFPLEQRMKDIDSYYESILTDSVPIPTQALDAVVKEWKAVSGLQLRSASRTVELMKKSTSSGNPFFEKKRVALDKTVPFQVETINKGGKITSIQHLPKGSWESCCILGWRGQEGGRKRTDVKQRVVWMYPFALNIAELQLYQPLIEAAQKFDLVPAWVGLDAVDARITKLFDTKSDDQLIVCTDFSKFDQHFNSDMAEGARYILQKLIQPKDHHWLDNIFPIKYGIPLAYDWEKVRYGRHGMASGSGGTNADETLTHRALQYEAAQSKGQILNPNSMCLGDDGILSYPGITVEDVTRVYSSHGQEMNIDKQYASAQDCTYLRRWHHRDYRIDGICVGVYSTARALGRLMEQERFYDEDWSKEMVALRQLSILENVKYHPLREEFVDFCMKGDKYRLGLDIPGFLNDIESIAKRATENMPDFLGYSKSLGKDATTGLNNWWVVKYLKSKA